MRSLLILSICLLSLGNIACKSKDKVKPQAENVENKYQQDWIKLTRSGCFGPCPIYNITIYGNGIVRYEGIRNTDKIGMFIGRMDPMRYQEIAERMEAIGFLEMQDVYETKVSDMPGSTILVHYGGLEKQVVENGDAPTELTKFQNYLDGIVAEISDWKEVMRK